jgi:peptide/nickel transport system substrate-binding protein
VAAFDPGEGITFVAYDGYFLGRPKLDTIRVQTFGDENALFAHLLTGSVQMFFQSTLNPELGAQLRERWAHSGEGTVTTVFGYTRFIVPQWRPSFQREPTVQDVRVRAALYHALDREVLSDAVQSGRRDLVAYAMLPPDDRNFAGSRDGLRQYGHQPERARALLREVGWTLDGERALRHESDGRRFRTSIWANSRWGSETAALADFWRQLGLEVEEFLIPVALTRDPEARATFPGWQTTSRYADGIFRLFEESPAGPENRWTGNGAGYEDLRAKRLVEIYRQSIAEPDQLQAIRQLTQFAADELPFLPLYYEADTIGVRKGVIAFDDVAGGAGSGAPYGFYSRNAHLWSVQ